MINCKANSAGRLRRCIQFTRWKLLLVPVAIAMWFGLSSKKLTLYVSNQSAAVDPVDIRVEIDGKVIANDHFKFGNGHIWIGTTIALRPGWHSITATSVEGEAKLHHDFAMFAARWAVIDYWYRPADPAAHQQTTPKQLTFNIQSRPIYFQ